MAASLGANNGQPQTQSVTPAPLQPNQGPAAAGPIPPQGTPTMNTNLGQPPQDPLSMLGAASRLTQRHARRLSSGSGGEFLHNLTKGFKEILEANANLESIRQIILDKQANTLDVSAIVICQKIEHAGVPIVAAHVLMIEATAGKLAPIVQNYQGNMVETPIVVGDLYNDNYWYHIQLAVQNTYGIKDLRVYEAGASVIHSEMDVENKGAIQEKLSLAIEATDRVLMPVIGAENPFSVSEIKNDGRVQSRVVFNPEQLYTSDGLPVRSDLNLALTFTQNGNQNYQYGQYDPSERVVEIVATDNFVNLMYNGNPAMQMMNMNPMMMGMQPPVYQAALVTTAVKSTIGQFDLPTFLLGILTNLTLTRDMSWINCFKPKFGQMPNLRDVGAIGYENPHLVQQADPQHPRGAKIDTMSTAFDNTQLYNLVQRAIQPSLLYQLLVRERGEDSWLSSIFLAAAGTGETATAAQTAIVAAANLLTDNHFGMYWTGGPITIENQNRVHLGYYVSNHNGEKRDILDIDYLAVANVLGEHDISMAGRFDATLQDFQPLPIRMAERLRIIAGIVGDFKHKGYGRIVTFTPTFLTALAQASHAAGLVINSAPQYLDGGLQRGNPLLASMGMAPAMMMGMGLFQNTGWGPNNMMYPGQQMRYGGIYGMR